MSFTQIQEGLSPNHLKKAKLMFFYTRYPSSNMLKMYFSDVKVRPTPSFVFSFLFEHVIAVLSHFCFSCALSCPPCLISCGRVQELAKNYICSKKAKVAFEIKCSLINTISPLRIRTWIVVTLRTYESV